MAGDPTETTIDSPHTDAITRLHTGGFAGWNVENGSTDKCDKTTQSRVEDRCGFASQQHSCCPVRWRFTWVCVLVGPVGGYIFP